MSPADNRNNLLNNCNTPLILFIDDDDVIIENSLSNISNLLYNYNNFACITSKVSFLREEPINEAVILHGKIFNLKYLNKFKLRFRNIISEDVNFNLKFFVLVLSNNLNIINYGDSFYFFNNKIDESRQSAIQSKFNTYNVINYLEEPIKLSKYNNEKSFTFLKTWIAHFFKIAVKLNKTDNLYSIIKLWNEKFKFTLNCYYYYNLFSGELSDDEKSSYMKLLGRLN